MIIDLTTRNYPETVRDLRTAFPNTIIPDNPSDADLDALGRARVQSVPVPEYDSITQSVRELGPEETPDGFFQQWEVYELSEEEIAANQRALVPPIVSRFQALAVMHLAGILPTIEAAMESPDADPLHKLAWKEAREFNRDSPTIAAMSAQLNMSEEEVDNLFILASTLEA